jgi:hypothetical protein
MTLDESEKSKGMPLKRSAFETSPSWWAFRDLNPGPTGYEPAALTN